MDGNTELATFCKALEEVIVATVEAGFMTKDLAICIHGDNVKRENYMNTGDFINKLAEELTKRLEK